VWYVASRIMEYSRNGRAEGGAAEADGKDVWRCGAVVQQVVTELGCRTSRNTNTKRVRQVTSSRAKLQHSHSSRSP
jgi:hypothetical protein